MDEFEDKMSTDSKINNGGNPPDKDKPKKRSLVERELETTLTPHLTSPLPGGDGINTSRYGRARRLKNSSEFCDTEKSVTELLKSPNMNYQPTSPVYKMQASNSLIHETSPRKLTESNLENQIENIFNTNISLSRFGSDEKDAVATSPAKKISKVYIRKDLIQSKEKDDKDDPILLIKSIFSPAKSARKSNSHLSNVLERSSEKYDLSSQSQNSYLDTSSVVKTLDFDCSKKRKDRRESVKPTLSKSELFELEARCAFQVGDITWARMGTYPFWPCIVTREPGTDMFVRKKLFGKMERDTIHVTFFGDNGRRSWILDSLLRKYQGLAEFEAARDQFTPEAKKKDPRLYAAFFISDKKLALWHTAIEEADYILREPKRLRIDLLNELLGYSTSKQTPLKGQKSSKITRTDSDVSLSESLYDTLFSKDDGKVDETGHKKNKSLDVSDVVTACLDNMAAKTGLTQIQRKSHMDIWLQKAKSKTPEKSQVNISVTVERLEQEARKSKSKERDVNRKSRSLERDNNNPKKKRRPVTPRDGPIQKPYSFRKSTESQNLFAHQNEHDYSKNVTENLNHADDTTPHLNCSDETVIQCDNSICIIDKVESLRCLETTKEQDNITITDVNEEITVTDLIQDQEVTTKCDIEGNRANASQPTAMEEDDVNMRNEETVLEQSIEADLICESKSESTVYDKEIPRNEGVANKDANAFIIETDAQDARTVFLEETDQSKHTLKTDDGNKAIENEDRIQEIDTLQNMNMSLDNDVTSSGSNIENCTKNQEKELNIEGEDEISDEDVLKQIDLLVQSPKPQEEKQNDVQLDKPSVDSNMDVDDDVTAGISNQEKSQQQNSHEQSEKSIEEVGLPNTLTKVDGTVQVSELPNEKQTSNDNDIASDDSKITKTSSQNELIANSEFLTENVANTRDKYKNASDNEVKNHEMVPKMKLTIIKEADIKSFRITSPKRRSLRRNKIKKQDSKPMEEPQFLKYLEITQDSIIDEHPELSQEEIVAYLYKTWQFQNGVPEKESSRRNSKSPSDFVTEAVDSDAIVNNKFPENTKEQTKHVDVQASSETKSTTKRSLRLRNSQSPSVPQKTLENTKDKGLKLEKSTDIEASKPNETADKQDNKAEPDTNDIDCKITAAVEHTNNELGSESSLAIDETKPKDIYVVTPKKRSLCLRISKANYEPKVVLERSDINDRQNKLKSDIKSTLVDPVSNKQLIPNHKVPVLKVVKCKIDGDPSALPSVYEIKHSKRSSRKSKTFSEPVILLGDKEENDVLAEDKIDFNRKDACEESCIKPLENKVPIIEVVRLITDVEAETSKGHSHKSVELKQSDTAEESKVLNTDSEIRRSKRSTRKSKSLAELKSLEDSQESIAVLVTEQTDCEVTETDTGINVQTSDDIVPVLEDPRYLTDVSSESNSKRSAIKSKESKADVEAVAQTNSDIRRSKRRSRKSKSFSESSPSLKDQEEDNKMSIVGATACEPMVTDTEPCIQTPDDNMSVDTDAPSISDITESKTNVEAEVSLTYSETKRSKRRSHKSKSSSESIVSKDTEKNRVIPISNEIDCELMETDEQSCIQNDAPVIENAQCEKTLESEPALSQITNSKLIKLKEINCNTNAEIETFYSYPDSKHSKILLDRCKSPVALRLSIEDQEEKKTSDADVKDSKQTTTRSQSDDEISENKISVSNLQFERDVEIPLSKRRTLRLRKSQSASSMSSLKKLECSDLMVTNGINPVVTETKKNKSEISLDGQNVASDKTVIMTSQYESSNIDNVPELTKDHDEIMFIPRNSIDTISLNSELTNGFTDHSSDKDFDPDAVSISSLSSEISDIVVLSRITKRRSTVDKSNIIQKLLDPDNDSLSSMDDVTLSELKIRSTKEDTIQNLRHSLENSMDSVKSDASERRLRLVLTDCLLESKDSKLPIIKTVNAKTDEEFEISQSNSEVNIPEKPTEPAEVPIEPMVNGFHGPEKSPGQKNVELSKVEERIPDPDTISIKSSGSEASIKRKGKRQEYKPMEEPEFLQYVEMRQDALLDEHPEVSPDEAMSYLYKTWQYEESLKSDIMKNDEIDSSNLVKGVNQIIQEPQKKKKVSKQKKLINIEKILAKSPKKDHFKIVKSEPRLDKDLSARERDLPKRKASKPFYKEDFSDIEDEIEMFEIFKNKKKPVVLKTEPVKESSASDTTNVKLETTNAKSETMNVKSETATKDATVPSTVKDEVNTSAPKEEAIIDLEEEEDFEEYYDQEELYFEQLTNPKPNIFKGLIREKVCEICEKPSNLVKCKGCNGMFHIECVNKEDEIVEIPAPTRGRKKKKKPRGRKPKSSMESNEESHSDEKQDLNVSEENMSIEEINGLETIVIPDADTFESQLEEKMKEIIDLDKIEYDSYSSDDGIDWSDAIAGKCEIVDVKLKMRPQSVNMDDFKCKNCQKDPVPLCFVCKSPVSPKNNAERRQKCQVAHCHKYYHLECLEHWPQTQFNAGEPSRNNKKIDEHFEALTCPRHVCHTCVCDDPRGCKTRFSGDKLARCVRCPATYHSFTKCLPAGSQILSASHIVCPRHYEHRPGKIPYHVNTGWCFICALGGNLICCDYCPTSFHADCLNIEPPEGGYMCEDCETGRLPLYGEMVWVKLGHYRWWPGIILHPSEIPDNIMAVKHSPGEFVVRFFGQYDHYWVNRGRVFPFQEGDSGKISTQKSKIDEAFTKAMEHAQRAFEILKNVEPNDEENQDIQSSLLPPHYVKLKVNKPCGALYGRKVDIEESSLTQCECNPDEEDPCGPYSHCLNRMLLTECGPHCRAGERCQNRAFEKRQYPKMAPYRTPHRGWGLKTLEPIKAGQFVIEYVGELIDEAEFRRRMQRKHETRDENFYFLTLDKERLIDAGPKGNLARFMNHCCEPNCETQKWTVLGDVRVGLFALHDIPANTEVTFNYNLECTGIEKKQCMCGARRCAGYIGAKPKQEDPQPKKIKVAAKRTYKKRKNTVDSPSTSKQTNKPKRPVGRPAKPRELTDIEKDLLIIKNATNGISSDSECSGRLSVDDKEKKALKRKRVSFSTEEIVIYNGSSSPSVKRLKLDDDEKSSEIGD